jgi:predicted GNAT family N-acyltransferase
MGLNRRVKLINNPTNFQAKASFQHFTAFYGFIYQANDYLNAFMQHYFVVNLIFFSYILY